MDGALGDVLGSILALAVAAGLWWNGRKTWRGEEFGWAERYEARHGHPIDSDQGPLRPSLGTRRRYRTQSGAGHLGLMAGPGFLALLAGWALEGMIDDDSAASWIPTACNLVGVALLGGALVYLFVYLILGVPDRLRPPAQRGWEMVGGQLQLVRPQVFHEHPAARRHAGNAGGHDRADP